MTRRGRRMALVGLLLLAVSGAAALAFTAFQKNMTFFFSPTQVADGEAPLGYPFRLGGLVADGSVQRGDDLRVAFAISDGNRSIPVSYTGILPDLFREGQGVVARGRLVEGRFQAEEVLAKHDENYMPPEVAEALAQGKKLANPHAGQAAQ
ncbi:cytochrome c maturation protein CcmE [Alkalilimnicola sp. S0819]|uniref:cytochrome c maturation protein CcmE n=1 Tax=Alkalilimnicola sp. S0819 TaxID=2613922 RepID=UPI001261D881|nr:cytochrome c maturation protein CcmE [Alkalilimnicola sp. S0819]KAB7627488.1 cytochrome c maturation protein CcmE [Alkalilimnicola sp. S0819]MPQ15641.1 cytochrome c maturation protein CcmE [Alkalilimnicola sp. S0819]